MSRETPPRNLRDGRKLKGAEIMERLRIFRLVNIRKNLHEKYEGLLEEGEEEHRQVAKEKIVNAVIKELDYLLDCIATDDYVLKGEGKGIQIADYDLEKEFEDPLHTILEESEEEIMEELK